MRLFRTGKSLNPKACHSLTRTKSTQESWLREGNDANQDSEIRASSPLIMLTLPKSLYQLKMLDVIRRSLLQHHLDPALPTIYSHGPVEFLTFFNATNYAWLMCALDDSLASTAAKKMLSRLFHKLFHVDPVDNFTKHKWPINTRDFSPPIHDPIKVPAKLKNKLVRPDGYYGVAIRPRLSINIGGKAVLVQRKNDSFDAWDLVRFAYFLSSIAGCSGKKTTDTVLKRPSFARLGPVLSGLGYANGPLNKLPADLLEAAFVEICAQIDVPPDWQRANASILAA
ncbi:unnamed protein product, partial [Mesorhabditis spiculigera]